MATEQVGLPLTDFVFVITTFPDKQYCTRKMHILVETFGLTVQMQIVPC